MGLDRHHAEGEGAREVHDARHHVLEAVQPHGEGGGGGGRGGEGEVKVAGELEGHNVLGAQVDKVCSQ